ncbi:SDR family oxidoreductase [Streptomyces sp. NPDC020681]|uniref:SDR family oxidoreductase n=1 Tax=Streptomyces sp. NPDC020681 TaxID=3365083 RepID=UPI00378941DF
MKKVVNFLTALALEIAGPRAVPTAGPGTIRTPSWSGREDQLDALAHVYPLGRAGEPDDIAAGVAFLASRDVGWIRGTLRVEGDGWR